MLDFQNHWVEASYDDLLLALDFYNEFQAETGKALKQYIKEHCQRVDFILSDILTFLELCEDNSFDAFASVYTLHNFTPDFRIKVLELIAKKLKHGGVFINGDKYAESEEMHKTDLANEIKNYDKFYIVADKARKTKYAGKLALNTFVPIKTRVQFMDYDKLSEWHTKTFEIVSVENNLTF